jgi:carbonic anhydrase
MQTPITFSQEQIDTYGEILADTNRPVQPLNDRAINGGAEQ